MSKYDLNLNKDEVQRKELRTHRSKERRSEAQYLALSAFNAILHELVMYEEGQFGNMPPLRKYTTTQISALVRLGHRVSPMLREAYRELERRYQDEARNRIRITKAGVGAMLQEAYSKIDQQYGKETRAQLRVRKRQCKQDLITKLSSAEGVIVEESTNKDDE